MDRWLAGIAARLDADVSAFVDGSPAPGAVAGVVVDRELVWSTGHGFADLESAETPAPGHASGWPP